MKGEAQTKERLLRIAKEEFLEKGYRDASLRNICKKADVTTGALYFFFKNKEDLYSSIVGDVLERIIKLIKAHYNEEIEGARPSYKNDTHEDDIEASVNIVNYLYNYYDEVKLLLTKSQGSKYENCIEEIVELTKNHYKRLMDIRVEKYNVKPIDDITITWVSHIQIDSFVYIINNDFTKEEALKQIRIMVKFLIQGWSNLLLD